MSEQRKKPGPKPDPSKPRSRHNPDNPNRSKVPPERRRRQRGIEYDECVNGHAMTPENTFEYKDSRYAGGVRKGCKICRRDSQRKYQGKEPLGTPVGVQNKDKTHCPSGHEYTPENTYLLQGKYRKCRRCLWLQQAKHHYGIEPEQLEQLLELQNSKCAICGQVFEQTPHVDHDHKTGEVRGLLCDSHNNGLGRFEDRVDWLQAAIDYLSNPPASKIGK